LKLSGLSEEVGTAHNLVHQLADITDTSAALGIFHGTLASARFLFGQNFLQYRRLVVPTNIAYDIGNSMIEAVANQVFHSLSFKSLLVLAQMTCSTNLSAEDDIHTDATRSPMKLSQILSFRSS
jgi:hypothetical protein